MSFLNPSARLTINSVPFNYMVVEDLFDPVLSSNFEYMFRDLIKNARGIGKVGEVGELIYDALNFTPKIEHLRNSPMSVFGSAEMREFISSSFDILLDENLMIGMHRHEPGSRPGWEHTDFTIVSFPNISPNFDGNRVYYEGCDCNYSDDSRDRQPNSIKTARAIACLYYTANPIWRPGMDGETGIYADLGKRVVHRVPPKSNSLLAFEISPISYHAFLGSPIVQRNSYIWWYHSNPKYLLERHNHSAELRRSLGQDPWDRWTGPEVPKYEP